MIQNLLRRNRPLYIKKDSRITSITELWIPQGFEVIEDKKKKRFLPIITTIIFLAIISIFFAINPQHPITQNIKKEVLLWGEKTDQQEELHQESI